MGCISGLISAFKQTSEAWFKQKSFWVLTCNLMGIEAIFLLEPLQFSLAEEIKPICSDHVNMSNGPLEYIFDISLIYLFR